MMDVRKYIIDETNEKCEVVEYLDTSVGNTNLHTETVAIHARLTNERNNPNATPKRRTSHRERGRDISFVIPTTTANHGRSIIGS